MEALTCAACQKARASALTGVYDFKCLPCCLRLTMTTYSDKRLAMKQIEAILRFRLAPTRETLMACVSQVWEKRRSALASAATPEKGACCER